MDFNRINFEEKETVDGYDDLPLWSAKSGELLLNNLQFKKNSMILDVGCGTGFPTIEIAQRVGKSSMVYGLDPWNKGIQKAKEKSRNKQISNIIFINGISQKMPFKEESFDQIVSNNGFNGKNGSIMVFNECNRVLKNGGKMSFTGILPNSMKNFYKILIKTMEEEGIKNSKEIINKHINEKRLNIKKYKLNLKNANFKITKIKKTSFKIKFVDEQAFFDYYFFKLNFFDDWLENIPKQLHNDAIKKIKEKIRKKIVKKGLFQLKINCIYIRGVKLRGREYG